MKIEAVTERNIDQAAYIHSVAWQASHCAFCRADFVRAHTPARQRGYLMEKLRRGAAIYMLWQDVPVGIVSVTGSLIEDLYVLPEYQRKGFGTRLLQYAVRQCDGAPTLWILENNTGALRLYQRHGFRLTGNAHRLSDTLSEVELQLNMGENT